MILCACVDRKLGRGRGYACHCAVGQLAVRLKRSAAVEAVHTCPVGPSDTVNIKTANLYGFIGDTCTGGELGRAHIYTIESQPLTDDSQHFP